MRVYGASPLYSYVELVFRSKRLFIVSIVLATLIVSIMATMRGGQYTAMSMILLTGKAETGLQNVDASQLGSVRYKLNMLSIFLKDPEFMKTAIRNAIKEQTGDPTAKVHVWETGAPVTYSFDPSLVASDVALDKFCKNARQSITFAQGEGILELSCRWPDRRAADIINAFFWEYHDQVVSYETTNSSLQENLLRKLVKDYKEREQNIEKEIIQYQRKHILQPAVDPNSASSKLVELQNQLEEQKLNLAQAQERRDAFALQLKTIPPTIVQSVVSQGAVKSPVYVAALQKKNDAVTNLESLKTKYQDSHPKVREAQAAVDAANLALTNAEKSANKNPNIESTTRIANPDYVRTMSIINNENANLKGLTASYDLRVKQAEAEKKRAYDSGKKNFEFKWLIDEYAIVGQIRTTLENRLQAAELTEKQEAQRSSAETAMVVKPASELESSGAKSLLLYASGPILGIIIAFAFSLVAETLDHSLRTPIEVEKHLGKPVLAVLPRMDPPKAARRQLSGGGERGQATLPPA